MAFSLPVRGFVLGLCLLTVVGCAGNGESTEPALVALLPMTLAGVELEKESFTGPEWLKARPETSSPYFLPEFRADPRRFLRRLGKRPQDLTVAWALAPEGIQVIAYRVRDAKASALVRAYVEAIGRNVRFRAPQANAFAERWVGTVRRDCLDWLLIGGPTQLERVLRIYVDHYNTHGPHRALGLTAPLPEPRLRLVGPSPPEQIHRRDRLGGLIHEYARAA